MRTLKRLFDNNKKWAAETKLREPDFFRELTEQQTPEYLWIGCSDSRVPPNNVVGVEPGEMFVHRNIANVVVHTDLNCLSVLQFAVEILQVKHIIVCGHYGCGGIRAALSSQQFGLIDNWLRTLKDLYRLHENELKRLPTDEVRVDRLCELNVAAQVANVCHTTIVQNAWSAGRSLSVHGWIYRIGDGLLQDLGLCFSNQQEVEEIYRIGTNT